MQNNIELYVEFSNKIGELLRLVGDINKLHHDSVAAVREEDIYMNDLLHFYELEKIEPGIYQKLGKEVRTSRKRRRLAKNNIEVTNMMNDKISWKSMDTTLQQLRRKLKEGIGTVKYRQDNKKYTYKQLVIEKDVKE